MPGIRLGKVVVQFINEQGETITRYVKRDNE